MFIEICMQIYSVVFAVDNLTSKKYAKTYNFLCTGNKDFVKYQAQEGVNPSTSPAYALAFLYIKRSLIGKK